MGSIRRGTTPTHTFNTNIDLTGSKVFITYTQKGQTVLEKTNDEVMIYDDHIDVTLSQTDTLSFNRSSIVSMQIRYVTDKGKAGASNIMTASVGELLKEGEIEYDI